MKVDKNLISCLQQAKSSSGSTSLITILIPGNYNLWLVRDFLAKEISTSNNIKDKNVSKDVKIAIKAAISQIKQYNKSPKNGLVLCTGIIEQKKSHV